MDRDVCLIIVTYNREILLRKCINKVLESVPNIGGIVVVNNASTDGTNEYLNTLNNNKIDVLNLPENIGGAGGFSKGIEHAFKKQYKYFWIMDDDTMINKNTLKYLIDEFEDLNEDVGFICSNVLFTDNNQCIMNIPKLSKNWGVNINRKLLKVDNASFVSILIKNEVVRDVGLPISEFFIWGDDLEYTKRISKKYNCYMSINSTVTHEMKENIGINIVSDSDSRLNRYYYEFRNKNYIYRKNRALMQYYIYVLKSIIKVILKSDKNKIRKLLVIFKGMKDGIMFNPKIRQVNANN